MQVEIPQGVIKQLSELADLPIKSNGELDVAFSVMWPYPTGVMPGQYDRYNMKRTINLTANSVLSIWDKRFAKLKLAMIAAGQHQRKSKLAFGSSSNILRATTRINLWLDLAIVVVFLLLAAYFHSLVLALATITACPSCLAGL